MADIETLDADDEPLIDEWAEAIEYDWPAIEGRLALLLFQFATKVIGEKINVNPLAADSAIRYCQSRIAGGPYVPARQEHFIDFILRHGGSVEWVMFGDISELLVGYAAGRPKMPRYQGILYDLNMVEPLDDEPLSA
ncbi:hypothetical protein [Bradyrhizobium sp. Ash2021]|uniref:hypothetical protein n=1 Tax=Bradyrhizobium sp. Ash2021 TaxID=2954771 RepID=UPI0028156B6B|nr:hypothetical protein [Bradyrhizobium sp. Ash2021]WMT78870.1 hypothetical protein NL528_22100 [Bradyrhizobium sp. Ash2021]